MRTCEQCNGQGFFAEYVGGRSNFYGSPNEREIPCPVCHGAGEIADALDRDLTLDLKPFQKKFREMQKVQRELLKEKVQREILEQINGLDDYDTRARVHGTKVQ